MSVFKNAGVHVAEYVWNFADDGGTAATYALDAKANYSKVPTGAIIKGVVAVVESAVTSAGAATGAWGDNSDADGFSGAAIAKAALVAGAVFNGHDNGAALLWDDTNDHAIYFMVDGSTNDGSVDFTIGTAAATAGRVRLLVEFYMPDTDI